MQAVITLLKDTIEYYYEEAHLRIGLKIEGIRLLQYSKTTNQHTWCLDKITDLDISKLSFNAFFIVLSRTWVRTSELPYWPHRWGNGTGKRLWRGTHRQPEGTTLGRTCITLYFWVNTARPRSDYSFRWRPCRAEKWFESSAQHDRTSDRYDP